MRKIFYPGRSKKKTMVFVDYEYWFYSCKTRFSMKPDPITWRDELVSVYDIADIMVFGDFTSPEMSAELSKLREITSTIIETGNTLGSHKKDMTDFVMLDYIYQCAATRHDIGRYIIFTGDGHFQSVVRYLIQKKRREVIVYGIRDSFSRQLQIAASSTVELSVDSAYRSCSQMIIRNLAHAGSDQSIIPTFNGTVEAVSRANDIPPERVRAALIKLINQGYVVHKTHEFEKGKTVKTVAADWELLAADGMLDEIMAQR